MVNDSYRNLYIGRGKSDDGRDLIWTTIGNDSLPSRNYRRDMWRKRAQCELDESRPIVKVELRSYDEAKHLQHTWNEVFKPWCNSARQQLIELPKPISDHDLQKLADCLKATMNLPREDKAPTKLGYMKRLASHFEHEVGTGYIYLMEVKGKYKIGLSNDPFIRSLMLADKYKDLPTIIDKKASSDMRLDEATLHIINSQYKSQNNESGEQSAYNTHCSELFEKHADVLYNWEQYWSNK